MSRLSLLLAAAALCLGSAPALLAQGAPPNLLHFQARISDSQGNPVVGPTTVELRIYAVAAGGAPLWSETQSPTALNGVVNLLAGSVAALPAALFDGDRYLALRVGADPEMTPRIPIAAVPFARRAASAAALEATSTIPAGLITSSHVLDGTIASADLADGSVGSSKLAAGSVGSAALAANAVDGGKILDGSVGTADLASGSITAAKLAAGAVTGASLAASAVASANIADATIATADLANGSVTTAKLAAAAVTMPTIAIGAVDTNRILDGTIQSSDLDNPMISGGSPNPTISAHASGSAGVAIRGDATSGIGTVFGVLGASNSTGGTGVSGVASAASGFTAGVRGASSSTDGRGVTGTASALTGQAYGVQGTTNSNNGRGVYGIASAAAGTTYGVAGEVNSTTGLGIYGFATAATGVNYGVYGITSSTSGRGVQGKATATSGINYGVVGASDSTTGQGVHGEVNAATGTNYGVVGVTPSSAGRGVYGYSSAASGSGIGVLGISDFFEGVHGESPATGVFGKTTSGGMGVYGEASGALSYGVFSFGNIGCSGLKMFVQPHPNDAAKEIRFVCLEGNESGTYFRGTSQLSAGLARIAVPEEFRLASEAENLTVQVTPVGAPAALWIESQDLDSIVVRGSGDVKFHYFVNGVRRGFGEHRAIQPNRSFVPAVRGVPYGAPLPDAARRILVENGILNADFTPNETTAARLGWKLQDAPAAEGGGK